MSNKSDWDSDDPDAFPGECDHCKRQLPCVKFLPCPFTAEIHPEEPNEPSNWCGSCYGEACDDI